MTQNYIPVFPLLMECAVCPSFNSPTNIASHSINFFLQSLDSVTSHRGPVTTSLNLTCFIAYKP